MNTTVTTQSLWRDSSTAERFATWMQDPDPWDEFFQSQMDLFRVRSTRDRDRPQSGMLKLARTNGVALASIVAAASIGHEFAYVMPKPPITLYIGDSSTAPSWVTSPKVFSAVPVNSAWQGIARSIDQWEQLQSGWDGDDATPPTAFTLESARHFLRLTMDSGAQPPKPFIASDGEIGFRWRNGEAVASVSFLDDGHIVVFCMGPKLAEPIKFDELYSKESDLTDLFKSLATFS